LQNCSAIGNQLFQFGESAIEAIEIPEKAEALSGKLCCKCEIEIPETLPEPQETLLQSPNWRKRKKLLHIKTSSKGS
jgi:hypothetical protein